MKIGGFQKFNNATSLAAFLACMGLYALLPSAAHAQSDLKNCHIIETGDMVCDGSTENGTVGAGGALGTVDQNTGKETTQTGPKLTGSIIISNLNECDGIQTISTGATKTVAKDGKVTMTFESKSQYKVGDHITVTGANDPSLNGNFVITEVNNKEISFKLPEGSTADGDIAGSVFATGDVADKAETDIEKCQSTETSTTEQKEEAIKKLQEEINQLQALLEQLKAQMSSQTLQEQQAAAQQLQQAQTSGGMGGLMGMLQQLLGQKPGSNPLSSLAGLNGTSTPQVTNSTTTSPTITQQQQEAATKAAKDNGTDFQREPKADGALCDQNKDDALGSRPLEQAVNQEIVHRFGAGSQKIEMSAQNVITGMTAVFDAGEGKSGSYHAMMDAATSEMILDDKAGVNSAIGVAKSINAALSKVPPSKLDHCFTTVIASAAYAHPDLQQKLKQAIELANLGKFKEAGEAAKAAVGGKLGDDLKAAFEALGGPVTMPPGMSSPKSPQEAVDQAKGLADKAAAAKAAAEKAAADAKAAEEQKKNQTTPLCIDNPGAAECRV